MKMFAVDFRAETMRKLGFCYVKTFRSMKKVVFRGEQIVFERVLVVIVEVSSSVLKRVFSR